ncbi:hypothetical protein [Alkaliphilus sp. B6464]|uniref:hypothetical protein n=1 Tax=Alkaliphilus sp. B6464 TaxID=2731219 RepID=UPI001BA4D713|nr:hypothetical protein [Alkaliphilus sp. B6464]QUH21433.1 hypothetical protein HYG84_17125 [Alkaliphilus sp. B6464]
MKEKYIDILYRKELEREKKRQDEIESCKCHRCEWSRWTGTKYTCMFLRCIK